MTASSVILVCSLTKNRCNSERVSTHVTSPTVHDAVGLLATPNCCPLHVFVSRSPPIRPRPLSLFSRCQGPGDNRIGTLVVETEEDKWVYKVTQGGVSLSCLNSAHNQRVCCDVDKNLQTSYYSIFFLQFVTERSWVRSERGLYNP